MTHTVSTRPPNTPATAERRSWPDNLRVLLIVLVLAHHAALTYGHIPIWPYTETAAPEDTAASLLDLLVVVNQTWFMGMFFLISGLFVPGSADRRGLGPFVRGRLLRLGVPYLAFVLVLRPLFLLPAYRGLPEAERLPFGWWYLISFDSGPMWFLLVLLVFSLGYAGLRAAGAPAAERLRVRSLKPGLVSVLLLGLTLGVVSGFWRLLVPADAYWPFIGLPSPAYLPQYLLAFTVGILAARLGWIEQLTRRDAIIAAPIALVTLAAGIVVQLVLPSTAGAFGAAILLSVAAAGLITALLVLFRNRFDRTNAALRSASANAFAIYVLHPVILVWTAVALSPLVQSVPHVGRFVILLVIGGALCWLVAAGLRRIPAVRRVL